MLTVNPIRERDTGSRERRAHECVELLDALHASQRSEINDESETEAAWTAPHWRMDAAVRSGGLLKFQEDERIADHICHGGGEEYLVRLESHYGSEVLAFFLSTYRESLCGSPTDLATVRGCYITRTAMRHLYHLAVLHQFTRSYFGRAMDFLEIGGGFGNLARLLREYSVAGRYYIVDVPISIVIQRYYLTEFFAGDEIAIWNGTDYLCGTSASPVRLVPSEAYVRLVSEFESPPFLISTMALTEFPEGLQDEYLSAVKAAAVYVYGQMDIQHLGGGVHLQGQALANTALFQRLAETSHVVDWREGDYHAELLGIPS